MSILDPDCISHYYPSPTPRMESIALLILVLAIHIMVINLFISKHGKLAREMVASKITQQKSVIFLRFLFLVVLCDSQCGSLFGFCGFWFLSVLTESSATFYNEVYIYFANNVILQTLGTGKIGRMEQAEVKSNSISFKSQDQ